MKVKLFNKTLVFDEGKFRYLILKHIDESYQQMAEEMNREMEIQLRGFDGINVPQSWIDEFLTNSRFEVINENGVFSIDLISRNFTNLYDKSEEATKARIILYGTGLIITKPEEMTWQDGKTSQSQLDSLTMSKAENEYRIAHFKHSGSSLMDSLVEVWNILVDRFDTDLSDYVTSDEFINSVLYIE